MRGCGGWQGVVQDSRSMKPRFRNTNLLITHVLDMCVKLLIVSNISSAHSTSLWQSQRAEGIQWTSSDLLVLRQRNMAHNLILMQLQRLTIAPAAYFTKQCHIHNCMSMPKASRKVVCVRCTSTLHAAWCILPRIKVGKAAYTSFQASPHHVLTSLPTLSPAQCKAQKSEDKDILYSMHINLITTWLSTAAKRRVVNRFYYSLSRIGLTTSSCASSRHARDLSLIFSKILSTFDQDHHSFVAECCTYFLQLLVRERKKKMKVGLKLGKESKRILNKYGQTLLLPKMIYNTKRSSDKRSESVNVRPYTQSNKHIERSDSVGSSLPKKERKNYTEGGGHYDRALPSLEVRETWLLELFSLTT